MDMLSRLWIPAAIKRDYRKYLERTESTRQRKRSKVNWKLFEDERISGGNVETPTSSVLVGKACGCQFLSLPRIGAPLSLLGSPILMGLGIRSDSG